jgi:hypothetical protein
MDAACQICERETSEEEPLGGWILRTELWSACVADGFEIPGWIFLELRRHAEGPMAMDGAEASELGPLLVQLTAGVERATQAEKVYVLAFGELFAHFHFVLAPRMPFSPPELTGPNLFLNRDQLVDRDAAAETALRICQSVSSQPDPS